MLFERTDGIAFADVRRREDHIGLVAHDTPVEGLRHLEARLARQGRIDLACEHALVSVQRIATQDADFDLGMIAREAREDVGDQTGEGRLDGEQAQLAPEVVAGGKQRQLAHGVNDGAGAFQDGNASFRQLHHLSGPLQQAGADLLLEDADALLDGRRGEVEPPGGFRNRAALRHGEQAFEIACLHG